MDCRLRDKNDGECSISDGAFENFGEVNDGLLLCVIELGKQGCRRWVGEGLCQGSHYDDGCIDRRCFRHWELMWKELHYFGGAVGSGLWNKELVAGIVFQGGT